MFTGGGKRCIVSFFELYEAFTLAEVLITLGIIGIVAAMTLPSLITKFQDKQLIAQTKKTYSTITNAVLMAQQDLGSIGDNTALFDVTKTSVEVSENFSKYFNSATVCTSAKDKGCIKDYKIKYTEAYTNGTGANVAYGMGFPMIILIDGSIIRVNQYSSCHRVEPGYAADENGDYKLDADGNKIPIEVVRTNCAIINFDVNGVKGPNQFGRDAYSIYIEPSSINTITWDKTGSASLKNILSGKDELVYGKYNVGDKPD